MRIQWNLVFVSISMELLKRHGIPLILSYDPEKFHGIPWNCKILILINFIIWEVFCTVCCMISCYYISDNPLVVKIMIHHSSKATFGAPILLKWLYSILNGGMLWTFNINPTHKLTDDTKFLSFSLFPLLYIFIRKYLLVKYAIVNVIHERYLDSIILNDWLIKQAHYWNGIYRWSNEK